MSDDHDGFDDTPKKKGMHGCAIAALVVGGLFCAILALGVVGGLLVPTITAGKEKANRAVCANNMRQLGTLALVYADDNEDTLPRDLEALLQQFPEVSADLLICPSDDSGTLCSYEIVPGAKMSDPMETVLIREIDPKHPGGQNAAFVDGHVQWIGDE